MTYLVAWQCRGEAFLCGDSIITTGPRGSSLFKPIKPGQGDLASSSFGEAHVLSSEKRATESALKVINFGEAALGLCGDWETGQIIAHDMLDLLGKKLLPRSALEAAIERNKHLTSVRDVVLCAIVFENHIPAVLVYDSSTDTIQKLPENKNSVHVGSVDLETKKTIDQLFSKLLLPSKLTPQELLVCALATLQSWGLRNYLIEPYGVGGVFCGVHTSNSRVQWQPDLLFVVGSQNHWKKGLAPDFVGVLVRDEVVIVKSTINQSPPKLLGNWITVDSIEDWRKKWDHLPPKIWESAFEYIVILDSLDLAILILQMNGNRASADARLRVQYSQPDNHPLLAIDLVSSLHEDLCGKSLNRNSDVLEGQFCFRPYKPPA